MKKNLYCYGFKNPWSSIRREFLTLKIVLIVLAFSILKASGSVYSPDPQQIVVSGKITDKGTGEPLTGVNIIVEGTTTGTISDISGGYTIQVPDKNAVLVFSSVGYVSQKVPVDGQSIIDINLVNDIKGLNEVVVTGYSTQRKKDITGAVSVVTTDALKSIPTGNAVIALQGLASGVNVIGSGAPGGRTDIFIRGVTSFGNTQPLVIVDGVPSSMDDLNMNDIESVQVLKDAGAASIYGVRGSNGVIVVTTKKGSGAIKVGFSSYVGVQVPKQGNVFNLLNSQDYAVLYKQVDPGTILFANGLPDYTYAGPGVAGTALEGDPAVDPSKYVFDANNPENDYLIQKVNKSGTDWFHEVFTPAMMQNYNLDISGGTDKANYLFSVEYLNQEGTCLNTFLKRYSTRMNSQFKVNKNFRVGENIYLFYKQNPGFDNMSEGNAVSMSYLMSPIIPVYDIMGNWGGTWDGPELGANPTNPVANQARTVNDRDNNWDIIGNVFAEVDFLKHFTVRTSFGGVIDNQYYFNFNFNQYNEKQGHMGENSFSENAAYNTSYTWTNTLTYSNIFGRNTVRLLIGSEAINNAGRGVGGGSKNFFSTNFNYLILNNGVSGITNYSTAYNSALYSLFSRLDYSFNDKYLLGATLRRDGSSRFGSDKRFGLFPAFSLGWRISNEEFMKNVEFINDLKVRGSYGVLGSQANVDPANAYSLYKSGFNSTSYSINGSPNSVIVGFAQGTIGNSNTGWEQDIITNIGLDATILNNRLSLNIEWYKKAINGLLFRLALPATAGNAIAPTVNVGDIQNTGLDIATTYHGNINKTFGYNIGLNITTYNNKVVRIPDPGYFDCAGTRMGDMVRNQVGHPVGSFFGYEVIGMFKSDEEVLNSPAQTDAEPGLLKYRDVNGDDEITPEDRTFFGNPNPDFTYGLNLGINYKGFDFSAIFYGSHGNEVMNWVRNYTEFFGSSQGKGKSNKLKDAWTPENPNSTTPKAQINSSFSADGVINSYYLENGSFMKLRSMILGYSIPTSTLERLKISEFRIYLQASNLFTITKYSGVDPELGGSLEGTESSSSFGIDYGNYPGNQPTYLIGVNVKF
jgi:TonB-linked SusC/RagA family outer membrane protein